jgi:hypothetical protein
VVSRNSPAFRYIISATLRVACAPPLAWRKGLGFRLHIIDAWPNRRSSHTLGKKKRGIGKGVGCGIGPGPSRSPGTAWRPLARWLQAKTVETEILVGQGNHDFRISMNTTHSERTNGPRSTRSVVGICHSSHLAGGFQALWHRHQCYAILFDKPGRTMGYIDLPVLMGESISCARVVDSILPQTPPLVQSYASQFVRGHACL